jgi:hypothetical protein
MRLGMGPPHESKSARQVPQTGAVGSSSSRPSAPLSPTGVDPIVSDANTLFNQHYPIAIAIAALAPPPAPARLERTQKSSAPHH